MLLHLALRTSCPPYKSLFFQRQHKLAPDKQKYSTARKADRKTDHCDAVTLSNSFLATYIRARSPARSIAVRFRV